MSTIYRQLHTDKLQLPTTSWKTPCYTILDNFLYQPVSIEIISFGICTIVRLQDIFESQKHLLSSKSISTSLHLNLTSTSTFDCAWFVPLLNRRINDKDCIRLFQFLADRGNLFKYYGQLYRISYYQTSAWCDISSSWQIFQDGYIHTMQEDYDSTTDCSTLLWTCV